MPMFHLFAACCLALGAARLPRPTARYPRAARTRWLGGTLAWTTGSLGLDTACASPDGRAGTYAADFGFVGS